MRNFEIRPSTDATFGVLELVFHAPDSANAFSLEAARELNSLLKSLFKSKAKPVAVMVRSGHPRVFCSGGNLSDYKLLKTKAEGMKINREIEAVLDSFGRWPVLKMAVIEGDVWGGGMEWLSRFDVRWASPSVLMGFWQKKIGLTTGWGGGACWAKQVGEERVRQWLQTAKVFGAWEAQAAGLVDKVALDSTIVREAHRYLATNTQLLTPELLRWTAKSERKVFSKLWLGDLHRKALSRWKG